MRDKEQCPASASTCVPHVLFMLKHLDEKFSYRALTVVIAPLSLAGGLDNFLETHLVSLNL